MKLRRPLLFGIDVPFGIDEKGGGEGLDSLFIVPK